MRLGKNEHPIRLGFLGTVLAIVYLAILVPAGFLEGSRLRSYDAYCRWRNALYSPPAEGNRVLLVSIDEPSQRHLARKWPWERGVFAEFLGKLSLAQPKGVVFDLVLAGESTPEQDALLAQAIREGPPVLLASYLDRHGDPVLPLALFTEAGARVGLINKPRDVDLTVRSLFAGIRLPMRREPLYAIEAEAAAIADGLSPEDLRLSADRLTLGSREVPLVLPGAMPINYLLSSRQVPTVSFWEVMEGRVPPERVTGRIILVGSASEITHDIYPTPLGLMPGVLISANGITTLLRADRFLRRPPFWASQAAGLLFVIAILLATYSLPIPWGMAAAGLLIGSGVWGGFLLLVHLKLQTEPLSILILGVLAWLIGILYRYLLLLADTVRLHHRVATDPVSGLFTARYFRIRLETDWPIRARPRRPMTLVAFQLGSPAELLQQATWAQVQERIRTLADKLKRLRPKRRLVGHLAEGTFGLLLPGTTLSQAGPWVERLKEDLQGVPWSFAAGLASTEQKGIASIPDLLQAAQQAANRALAGGSRSAAYDPAQDRLRHEGAGEDCAGAGQEQLEFVAGELEAKSHALERALEDLRKAHKEMEGHFLEVTKSLVMAMDTKDAYTAGHLERVARYATGLAEELRLPPDQVEAIREASLLHDIGKMHLPDEVLHKVGKLTPEEVAVIKQHLEYGAKILDPMKFFRPITTLLVHHHERYDGQGYPHGLTGEFIPAGAQVITVADSFDAMTTHRGYNRPKTVQEALEDLRRGAGTQFNPAHVEAFCRLIEREGPQLAGHQAA